MNGIKYDQPRVNSAGNTRDTVTSIARHATRLLFLLLVCLSPFPLLADPPERISVAYSIDSIPFQYTDERGEPSGIIIDYWRLWSRKTGIAINFIGAPWNETLTLTRDGKVDAHAGLFFNEDRDRFLDYGVALTRTDTNVFFHNSIGIPDDVRKLSAYRIGVLGKDFVEGYLKEQVEPDAVVGFPDYSMIMEKIQSGELKVFAADTPTGLYHLAQAGLLAKFHYDHLTPLYQNDWLVASSEGNAGILELINQGMALITPEERKRIERRWVSGMPGEASDAIIIAISSNYAPFSTIGIDGKPGGYLVDLWREWGRQVGRDVEFRASNWLDTLGGIKSGEADIHSGLFRSLERGAWLAFSGPFLEIETAVYFKSGKRDTVPHDTLSDVGVGAIRGSFQEEYLTRKYPGKQLVRYEDIDELLTGLLLEQVDVVIAEVPEMTSALNRLGITGAAQQGRVLFSDEVLAAVLKENADLLALVNRGLKAIPSDTLVAIDERWMPHGLDWKSVTAWVAPLVGGSFLVIIFVAVWNRRLGREVRERKRVELALAKAKEVADTANRAKSAFLANMSHELRTPMNAILGYSEMLAEEAEDLGQKEFIPDLKKINQAGTHLLALINDVLDLSKIESGNMEAFAEDFDVGTLLEEVIGTVQTLVDKNGNQLRIEHSEHLGTAHQDLTKVRQSLFNLLSNAAKFTHEGTITLSVQRSTERGKDWLTFAVRDSGIGIPEDKLEHVFKEFGQADDSTTRNYGGTGLGLPISRSFCQLMGGDLTVESQPGEGSIFTIRLPAELPGTRTAATVEDVETSTGDDGEAMIPAGTDKTVLVIDDDQEAREIVGRFLEKDGFSVAYAASGEEGLRLAHTLHPAAITLDVIMPDMDGWSVLRTLKADPAMRDIPVIMLTVTDHKGRGFSLGATDYLTKPVDRERLYQALAGYQRTGKGSTVLLVEDDEDARDVMVRTLDKANWTVIEAGNGREALDQLGKSRPELILLDLMMPVMDGFDFLLEMRAHPEWQDIPVIVLTAQDLTDEDRRILHGRVEQFVEKGSASPEQIVTRIRQLLP